MQRKGQYDIYKFFHRGTKIVQRYEKSLLANVPYREPSTNKNLLATHCSKEVYTYKVILFFF